MNLRTSPAGRAFITKQEGLVLHPYRDQAGIPTIGVGHVILPGEDFSLGISASTADVLLTHDLGRAENAVNGLVNSELTQNAFDALVSFTFNCGGGALKSSSVLSKLNASDYEGAAAAFLLWDKISVNGKLVPNAGLLARRKAEAALFLTQDA